MYQHYKKSNDTLEAFSYYKSYFDRVTAHLMYYKGIERAGKGKPNYKMYYKEGPIKMGFKRIEFNQEITDIDDLIKSGIYMRGRSNLLIRS